MFLNQQSKILHVPNIFNGMKIRKYIKSVRYTMQVIYKDELFFFNTALEAITHEEIELNSSV